MKHSKILITAVTCIVLVLTVLFSGCTNSNGTKEETTAPQTSAGDSASNGANASNEPPQVLEDVPTKNPKNPA